MNENMRTYYNFIRTHSVIGKTPADQPQVIREVVIAMLRTHPMGREIIDEVILWDKCLGKLSRSEPPETEDEKKMMGKIIEDIFDFIEKVDSLNKV